VVKKLLIQGNEIQVKRIIELFEREGEQLDKLLHPQIPRLYAYFAHENGLYLVQEYIELKKIQTIQIITNMIFMIKKLRNIFKDKILNV
jgi:serine/threonine protein kinase